MHRNGNWIRSLQFKARCAIARSMEFCHSFVLPFSGAQTMIELK